MPDEKPADAAQQPAAGDAPPPWSAEDYDRERAWKKIQAQKADRDKLAAKLAEFEKAAKERADAEMTELQRAVARAEAAEKALADRDTADKRKDVLKTHGLTDDDAEFLAGVPLDELDAKAQALAARLGIKKDNGPGTELPTRPAPKLTPGHKTEGSSAPDPKSAADRIYNGR